MAESVPVSNGAEPKRRKATAICLIITQLFHLLLIAPWAVVASAVWIEALDTDVYSPNNQVAHFFAWSLLATIASYPIVVLISAILAWVLYAQHKHHRSFWVNSIPLALLTVWMSIFTPLSILAHPASMISIRVWWWAWVVVAFFLLVWTVWILMAKAIGLSLRRRPLGTGN